MMIRIKRLAGLAAVRAVAVLAGIGAVAGVIAGDAAAQSGFTPGFYVSGFGGGSALIGQDVINSDGSAKFDIDFDLGFAAGAAAGYRFSQNIRLEVEAAYRQHSVGEIESLGTPSTMVGGDISAWSGMLNGYLDFGQNQLRPYVGLGLGFANVTINNMQATDGAGTLTIDDSDTVLAFQAMAGAAYQLTEEWSVFGEYRFFGTDSISASGTPNDMEYQSHNFQIGGRYDF